MSDIHFENRREAGQRLSEKLGTYARRKDVIVLALPRGGVPVGYEVAKALDVDFDVVVVRKLGFPGIAELAMGAICSGGVLYLNQEIIESAGASPQDIERVVLQEREELARRESLYRGQHAPPNLSGRLVIVVDDGIATGATMRAAVMALRSRGPMKIVVAVPVAPSVARNTMLTVADEFISVAIMTPFYAVGQFYQHFDQTSDKEVCTLLDRNRREMT